jgi:hypothetical protein
VTLAPKIVLLASLAVIAGGSVLAQEHPARPPAHGEPHPGPQGYQRVTEPHGWDARPANVDRASYQHNFQAARSLHIGL